MTFGDFVAYGFNIDASLVMLELQLEESHNPTLRQIRRRQFLLCISPGTSQRLQLILQWPGQAFNVLAYDHYTLSGGSS